MDGYTLEQAKQIMARHFPELADPDVKTERAGDDTVYVFTKKAGRKGAKRPRSSVLVTRTEERGSGDIAPTRDIQCVLRQVPAAHISPALVTVAIALRNNLPAEPDSLQIEWQRAESAAVDALHDRLRDIPPAVALDGEALL
jgi:hypothetical protein